MRVVYQVPHGFICEEHLKPMSPLRQLALEFGSSVSDSSEATLAPADYKNVPAAFRTSQDSESKQALTMSSTSPHSVKRYSREPTQAINSTFFM